MKVTFSIPTAAAHALYLNSAHIDPLDPNATVGFAIVIINGKTEPRYLTHQQLDKLITDKTPHQIVFGPATFSRKDLREQIAANVESNIA